MSPAEIDDFLRSRPNGCPNGIPGCSPLLGLGAVFRDAAMRNGLDPRLLIALAGVESGYGTSNVATVHRNVLGIRRAGSTEWRTFASFADCINYTASMLRDRLKAGHRSIADIYIAARYCDPAEGPCSTKALEQIVSDRRLAGGGDTQDIRSDCSAVCGNDLAEPNEQCDGLDQARCVGRCNTNCRCSVCGNGVLEAGEECDGSAPHPGACASQSCRANCTIDCGACQACINNTCTSIAPVATAIRFAKLVRQDESPIDCDCDCGGFPPPCCHCCGGADVFVDYFSCDGVKRGGCGFNSLGCGGPAGSCSDIPACDSHRHLAFAWGYLESCSSGPNGSCGGPTSCSGDAPVLPSSEFPPELNHVFDFRGQAEKDAGCCTMP